MSQPISRRRFMQTTAVAGAALAAVAAPVLAQNNRAAATQGNTMNLNLTQEWDKKFPQSSQVSHRKITFTNRYGITLAAD